MSCNNQISDAQKRGVELLRNLYLDNNLTGLNLDTKWYYEKVVDRNNKFEFPEYALYYEDNYKNFFVENFDPELITGTLHSRYNDGNWLEMLGNLKRFKGAKAGYRLNHEDKKKDFSTYINNLDKIYLFKYGDKYFIAQGNNRLCTAKFLGIKINTILIYEFHLNNIAYDRWNWLEKQSIMAIPKKDNKYSNIKWNINILNNIVCINDDLFDKFMKFYSDTNKPSIWQNLVRSKKKIPSDKDYLICSEKHFKEIKFLIKERKNRISKNLKLNETKELFTKFEK